MSLIEEMEELGADINDALTRFMGNRDLYEKMLKKFPKAVADSPVQNFLNSGDIEEAASNAHALKGVTGNLSLTPLYNNYTEIVNLCRGENVEKATELLNETLKLQQMFLDRISKYL